MYQQIRLHDSNAFSRLLIAARFGIKTLAISYDYKVEKLAKELNLPCISLDSNTNFEHFISLMKCIDRQNLLEIVNQKQFNWSYLEKLLIAK